MDATKNEHIKLDARTWALVSRVAAGSLFAGFVLGIGSTAAVAPATTDMTPALRSGGAWSAEHAAIPAANDDDYATGDNGLPYPTF